MTVAVLLAAVGLLVALVLQRRSNDAPARASWTVPAQLDRADFGRPRAPWLVVAFTSAACDACASVVAAARLVEAADVAVQEVEITADPALHDRYGVDAVPMLVVADGEGVVRASFVGAPDLGARLEDVLAGLRAEE